MNKTHLNQNNQFYQKNNYKMMNKSSQSKSRMRNKMKKNNKMSSKQTKKLPFMKNLNLPQYKKAITMNLSQILRIFTAHKN